jgi:carbohydrate diacid regulator
LEEIKEITRTNFALYNEKGILLAHTLHMAGLEDLESLVVSFANSMAESQSLDHHHFFKILLEEQPAYILLAESEGKESHMVGRLAVCQIRNLALSCLEQFDRSNFMHNLLLGTMLVGDIYNKAKRMHIEQAKRIVFIIDAIGEKDRTVIEYLKQMFSSAREFITEMDEKSIVLVKDISCMEQEDEWQQVAKNIVDTLQTEAMVRVRVAYGNPAEQLQDIQRSFREAQTALKVGNVFFVEMETFAYAKLGIGRLLYQIPRELSQLFLKEIFGEKIPDIFDEETNTIIQKFFENNLNISETARQLFSHRNTLVYRLDRIQKTIGLDVRVFEDALVYRIACMVMANLNQETKRNG